MTTIIAFVLGLIIGWIAEWAIDWFYWRKKTRQAETKAANLESQLTQLQNEQANEFAALRADLADRDQQIEAIEADLAELPSEEVEAVSDYETPAPQTGSGLGAFAAGAAVASLLDNAGEAEAELPQPDEEETPLAFLPQPDEEETPLAEIPLEDEDELQQVAPIPAFLLEEDESQPAEASSFFIEEQSEAGEAPVDEPAAEVVEEADQTQASPVDELAKYKKDIEYVEGIGPVYGEKLRAAGIPNPLLLLQQGATAKGRAQIAERSGIRPDLILNWVNHVDLYRIKGIGSEYAELLEVAGVDTVVELALRNPDHLYERLLAVNEEKKLVRQPPSLAQVQNWVEQAKILPRVITY